eukprot:Cvel_22619.t2-p1 / transcript=Cvel_22619.t2 / gene=Cvel_22619 / organism=Chromera_velia_CCMP2878 / gene_product=hypothetical protein / transcript_product=hypothetical protein / location=Cvel_scaffold2240:19059-19355(+) / protein_length=99 / sequence_SO=supercontig / SO=protein_coding / is_pseudo=false
MAEGVWALSSEGDQQQLCATAERLSEASEKLSEASARAGKSMSQSRASLDADLEDGMEGEEEAGEGGVREANSSSAAAVTLSRPRGCPRKHPAPAEAAT